MKRLFLLALLFLAGNVFAFKSPFEFEWDNNAIKTAPGSEIKTDIVIRVPPKHFIYKDKTELNFTALSGLRVKKINYPDGITHRDEITGKTSIIFPEGEVVINIILYAPKDANGEEELSAILRFQGCEEKLCLRPEEHELTWIIDIGPVVAIEQPEQGKIERGNISISSLLNIKDFKDVVSHGRHIALLIALLAGLLTSMTPCVWPLIPVTLMIIGIHKKGNFLGNLLLSLSLIMGIAITYSILGIIAAATGSHIGFLFQSKIFLIFVVIFLMLMSLAMFGVFTIQLPIRFQNLLTKIGGKGYRGAFLTGISLGLLATPCAGPILAPMLLWVASQGKFVFGAELLIVYALGMGLAYLIVGTFYGTLAGKVRNVRMGNIIKKVLGVALMLPALYYLSSVIPYTWTNGNVKWQSNLDQAQVEAIAGKKPIMVVFGAKWCPPCVILEKTVLKNASVVQKLKQLIPVHIDATTETPEIKKIIDNYNVIGWPTILFVSPNGKVYEDLTIVGDVPAVDTLIGAIEKAINYSKSSPPFKPVRRGGGE